MYRIYTYTKKLKQWMVLTYCCLGFFVQLNAQNLGFEWAANATKLLKFPVVKNGVYRISGLQMQQAGWQLNDIKPAQIAMYKMGQELPILLQLNNPNQLQVTDAILFNATKNEGLLDQQLYEQNSDQPHTYNSLLDDTAWYFLSIDTAFQRQAIRYTYPLPIDTTGLIPFSTFNKQTILAPQEYYYRGKRLPANESYYVATYAGGESWSSSPIAKGQSRLFNFSVPAFKPQSEIKMKAIVMGVSDYFVSGNNLPNHHFRISIVDKVSNLFSLIDTFYSGAIPISIQASFNSDLIDTAFQVRVEVIDDLGLGTDVQVLSLIEIHSTQDRLSSAIGVQKLVAAAGSKGLLEIQQQSADSFLIFNLADLKAYWVKEKIAIQLENANAEIAICHPDSILTITALHTTQVQTNFNDDSIAYVIVSSQKIETSAKAYANYRSNQYHTRLFLIEDLANTYTYGYKHPLAIQRLCRHLYLLQKQAPRFLFLLGKGYQIDILKQNQQSILDNLVPSIGDPPSDQLFTEKLNANSYFPAFATGRLPASSNEEVLHYLNKIQESENNSSALAWWKKQALHVSGGTDYQTEQLPYTQVLNGLKPIIENNKLGYQVHTYNQNNKNPHTENQLAQLVKYQNEGLQLFTFLGHGSLSVLDVSIGSLSDLTESHKPAFYYFNGCAIGNPATLSPQGSGKIYAKDYLCSPNKGAIGWLAHANLTLNGPLFAQMEQVYQSIATYSGSIGEQLQQALNQYTADKDLYKIEHARQLILQGDPAYQLYQPKLPDIQIDDQSIWIQTPAIHAQLAQIQVAIWVKNLGKSFADSVTVLVKRTLPNQEQIQLPSLRFPIPNNADTIVYTLSGILPDQAGLNQLDIQLVIADSLNEYNTSNNHAHLVFYLPGSGLQPLFPLQFSNSSSDTLLLSVQQLKQQISPGSILFEIDTTPTFLKSSSAYQQFLKTSKSNLYQQTIVCPAPDSSVYWWRAKSVEDSVFVIGTFKKDKRFSNQFSQTNFYQFMQESTLQQLIPDTSLKRFNFENNFWNIGIENRRWDHRMMGVTEPYLLNEGVGNCISQGVVALAFDPNLVAMPQEIAAFPFNCTYVQNNKSNISNRYYTFNTNTLSGEQELVQFIQSVPDHFEIAMFSRYASHIHSWQIATKQALSSIGANKSIQLQTDNSAWAIIGSKANPLQSEEDTVSNVELAGNVHLPPLPNEAQDINYLKINKQVNGKWYNGSLSTQWVGPAANFNKFKAEFKLLEPSDKISVQCLVQNKQSIDSMLFETNQFDSISIADFTKQKSPYLKFIFNFTDSINRTPAQLSKWTLTYDPLPELLVDPFNGIPFIPSQIIQGDQVTLNLPVRNISTTPADSCEIQWKIIDSLQHQVYFNKSLIAPIIGLDTTDVNITFSSHLLTGKCALELEINPNHLFQEVNYSNNYLKTYFQVIPDNSAPALEVLVDGRKIISGEMVSAKPGIELRLTDSHYIGQNIDSIPFELKLRKPNQTQFETINLHAANVKYTSSNGPNSQAILNYYPVFDMDGIYTLRARAVDGIGNWTVQPIEIQMEVKNAAAISHFYPYPNPFTSQMRFVFTLTGSEIPEQILIRIFTVDGRLVKEVSQSELGNIHIGTNISSWYWDGTDQFGDQLANGVYFYTVHTQLNGKQLEVNPVNNKENERYFKANTGKIYLMR